jgi:hypothetical protein
MIRWPLLARQAHAAPRDHAAAALRPVDLRPARRDIARRTGRDVLALRDAGRRRARGLPLPGRRQVLHLRARAAELPGRRALRDLPPGPARASLERRVADGVCTPHGLDVDRRRARALPGSSPPRPSAATPTCAARTTSTRPAACAASGATATACARPGTASTTAAPPASGSGGPLEALLTLVERELSHWCACQVLYRATPPGPAPDADRRRRRRADDTPEWLAWSAHAAAYYRECAALVDELTWPEVQTIAGPEIEPLLLELRAAHAAIQTSARPESRSRPLVPGLVRISHRGPSSTRVVTYSDSDAIDLPSELVALLPRFDGRPTERRPRRARPRRRRPHPALVARLVDFAVLAPRRRE